MWPNLSNLCFCLIKHILKNAQLNDAKQQMATNIVFIFCKQTLIIPLQYSYATKSYIDLELLTFTQSWMTHIFD